MPDDKRSVVKDLREQPLLAHGNDQYVGLAWGVLEWLERHVTADMTTLETGAGASTVMFAALGAEHVAISPSRTEHQRIADYCVEHDISLERVELLPELSHVALTKLWQPRPLDVVLIDGAHAFPYPVLDWFYTAPHVRLGGWLLLDDAHMPSVNELARYLRSNPAWVLDQVPGYRTPCFRKVSEADPTFDSSQSEFDPRADEALARYGGHYKFDYLPWNRRAITWSRHRFIDRTPLRRLVAQALTRRGRT